MPGTGRASDGEIDGSEKVLLGLASANRDESIYSDPEEFRLDRGGQPPHVGFGWGRRGRRRFRDHEVLVRMVASARP